MYIQLGNIILEPLNSPVSHSITQDTVWAEHGLLNSKPRLQPTGQGLIELTMSLRLHALFCNIKTSWKALTDARDNYTVLPLLWGNGEVGGNYVITQMSNNRESSFTDGTPESELVSITLKEYVVTPAQAVQKEKTDAQANAKAVNNSKTGAKKTTVANKVTNPPTCNAYIATQRSRLTGYSTGITTKNQQRNTLVLSLSYDRNPLFGVIELLVAATNSVINICNDISQNHGTCMQGAMSYNVARINSAATDYLNYLNSNKALDQFSIALGNSLVATLNLKINTFVSATQDMGNAGALRTG